jgi:hypothetical protein
MRSELNIREIDSVAYAKLAEEVHYVYNNRRFLDTVQAETENIRYFTIGASKPKVFFFISEVNQQFVMPFSAPFWNIERVKNHLSTQSIYNIVYVLHQFFKESAKNVLITLPPTIYDSTQISTLTNALIYYGFKIKYYDINHHILLSNYNLPNYRRLLDSNTKRNLRIANNHHLTLNISNSSDEIRDAYEIIQENRNVKQYPLRISEQKLHHTLQKIGGEVITVKYKDEVIASAFVYNINQKVKQLIYWGDKPAHRNLKVMNYLADQIVSYYSELNYSYIDLGPSSSGGVPNFGLSTFKESIGAEISLKATLFNNYKVY